MMIPGLAPVWTALRRAAPKPQKCRRTNRVSSGKIPSKALGDVHECVNSILVPRKLITLRAGARSHLFVPLRGLIRTSGKCFFFLGGSRVQVSNRTDATATMSASEYGTKVFVGDVATKVRVLLWCLSRRTRLVLPPYLAACGPLSTPWAQASHCPLLSPGRGRSPARGQHT